MIKGLLFCYFLLVIGFAISFGQLYSSKKRVRLRRIISTLLGFKYLDSKDAEFQNGSYDCGVASTKMLFKKMRFAEASVIFDDQELMNKHPLICMSDICMFLNNWGFETKGYEFSTIDYLNKLLNSENKKYSLLLLKKYDIYWGVTPFVLLLFPFILLNIILTSLKLLPKRIFHWVLLDGLDGGGVTLYDPLLGKVFIKKAYFERLWTKYGIVIEKKK